MPMGETSNKRSDRCVNTHRPFEQKLASNQVFTSQLQIYEK
jgi:hypothetical protein